MMILADTHCDTLYKLTIENKMFQENDLHISLDKPAAYGGYAQFFACFSDPVYQGSAKEKCLDMIDTFYGITEKYCDRMMHCTCVKDMEAAIKEGKYAAFLSIEGAEPIESLSDLRNFYRLGVRMIALTWNPENPIATGVSGNPQRGVTQFGASVVREMNRLGMAVDVSHLNERSFWEVIEIANAPVIASHSNAKAVCSHKRNLTDKQFEAIRDLGGYVGINLYPLFLNDSGKAGICDIIRHIEHFMALGGENTIGIGADFDGVDSLPEDIADVGDVYKIFDKLAALGYSDSLINKISFENFKTMVKTMIG